MGRSLLADTWRTAFAELRFIRVRVSSVCPTHSKWWITRGAHRWSSHTDQGKTREHISAIIIPSLSSLSFTHEIPGRTIFPWDLVLGIWAFPGNNTNRSV